MDWANPLDWISWAYGKYFQGYPTLAGVIFVSLFALLGALFGMVLWSRGVDKYKERNPEPVPTRAGFQLNSGNRVYLGRNNVANGGILSSTGTVNDLTAIDNQANLTGSISSNPAFVWDYDDWLQYLEDAQATQTAKDLREVVRKVHITLESEWAHDSSEDRERKMRELKTVERKLLAAKDRAELTKFADYYKSNPPSFAKPKR